MVNKRKMIELLLYVAAIIVGIFLLAQDGQFDTETVAIGTETVVTDQWTVMTKEAYKTYKGDK